MCFSGVEFGSIAWKAIILTVRLQAQSQNIVAMFLKNTET